MPDPWVPERGRLFLRELTAQVAMSASPNCNDVADAIDMDEHESGEVMHWLARESLVCEIGPVEREPVPPFSCDPYTMGPLELTSRGAYFRASGELPPA